MTENHIWSSYMCSYNVNKTLENNMVDDLMGSLSEIDSGFNCVNLSHIALVFLRIVEVVMMCRSARNKLGYQVKLIVVSFVLI